MMIAQKHYIKWATTVARMIAQKYSMILARTIARMIATMIANSKQ